MYHVTFSDLVIMMKLAKSEIAEDLLYSIRTIRKINTGDDHGTLCGKTVLKELRRSS